jgi:hypothetical protein
VSSGVGLSTSFISFNVDFSSNDVLVRIDLGSGLSQWSKRNGLLYMAVGGVHLRLTHSRTQWYNAGKECSNLDRQSIVKGET